MTAAIQRASELLRTVGPGRFLIVGADQELRSQLLRSACQVDIVAPARTRHRLHATDHRYDTIVLDATALVEIADPARFFRSIRAHAGRFIALAPGEATSALRAAGLRALSATWATALITCGFRRSPAWFSTTRFTRPTQSSLGDLEVYERLDDAAASRWPVAPLQSEFHADATRSFGSRADARLARYALAAEWVRPGDAVLHVSCGAGDGTALLAACSRGARFIGVDAAPEISYAQANFGERYGIEFLVSATRAIDSIRDASIDFLVAFDIGLDGTATLIDEIARVLKPDGRMIISTGDRTPPGKGGTPLKDHLARHFLLEAQFHQRRGDGCPPLPERQPLGLDGTDDPILIASSNPIVTRGARYRHPAFARATMLAGDLVRFDQHYVNPWLYRPLVQMGERLAEDALLRELALTVLSESPTDSPDFGAAATVLAYQILANGQFGLLDDLQQVATDYSHHQTANPHTRRWQISLLFSVALLCLADDRHARALSLFEQVAARDALDFSPLLATKTVAANFWLGALQLAAGRIGAARAAFRAGVAAATAALQATGDGAIGNPEDPLPFAFQELAEVADMASQCATALTNLEHYARSPGRFWSAVDTKRFGLATWCLRLQKENDALRAELTARRASEHPARARTPAQAAIAS